MRELKSIKIRSISLMPHAKNNLPVFFPASNMIELKNVVLNSADGLLTVIVYDLEVGIIKDCSVAPDVAYNMAHDYLRSGAKLERFHSGRAIRKSQAAVVESYVVQQGDPRFRNIRDYENQLIDVTGAWVVVIKLFDKNLKALYRGMQAWNGVSIFGEASIKEEPEVSRHSKAPLKMVMG
jgi:hypothetical protein